MGGAMTRQELLDAWRESLAVRDARIKAYKAGQDVHIGIIEADIANLQWFMTKLLEVQHTHPQHHQQRPCWWD